ncbi:MAG: hypothetical protein L0387_13860 [Acidobacteria bacterium]|nr:hypothetical protein [Acidobacteriota bacterium]MCI0718910.1 hypothetical protein [Acidobacteriota bacterium]
MNSTKPTPPGWTGAGLPTRNRGKDIIQRLLAVIALAAVFCSSARGDDPKPPGESLNDDRLSPSEEEFAYATKSPAERVAAFLKIADRKMETAKRLQKTGSFEAIVACLRGYSSALHGAVMAVSWGENLGSDMQRQTAAINKATRRHSAILKKLEGTATAGQEPMHQIREALASTQLAEPVRKRLSPTPSAMR